MFCHVGIDARLSQAYARLRGAASRAPIVSARTARARRRTVELAPMEIFLHLWDELDDLTGVCRHVATTTTSELLEGAAPLIAGASALGIWVLGGAYRQLLRLTA